MFSNQAKLFFPQFRLCVKYLHQQPVFSAHQKESQSSSSTFPNHHVYQNIYPWNRLEQFVDHLLSQTLYSDNDIIAIAKPFGVGIYNPYDKSNLPDKIEPNIFGDPRYCIADALETLSEKLNTPDLSICITENRIVSGIIVLAKSSKGSKRTKDAYLRGKMAKDQVFTFHCLTHGPPMMKEPIVEEIVAIQEICVNENTKQKEPEIIYNLSKSQIRRRDEIRRIKAILKVLDYNSSLNVALVEISCNRTNYHFVRCYLASRACYILGDSRFSRRVGHILGVPYSLRAANMKPREESLTNGIRKILDVPKNKSIPLMIHQVKLSLTNYTKNTDLTIENYTYPKHFNWTMNKLLTTKYQ
ncbi:mitochondrial mRNA pseudouridine synthase RPUSD3-like [Panonychus citri]|uniref:mitochondrial mRNA pseudouridine synthase RPUSD3-like n=1 Tax=Panonychus citri TaxID=50023 RepID=UPI002306FA66|nr:mitochondrial mRNA pseudouridine synthase RPUSD3-like [Panonychus citri]